VFLFERYRATRDHSVALCAPLCVEDHVVQPEWFVSPPKWHLAHTTWFFETFALSGEPPFDPGFAALFNSYYQSQGVPWQQERRGALSRPTVQRVLEYRAAIDRKIAERIGDGIDDVVELGIHHEQQHHELLVMDIHAIYGANPSLPAYREEDPRPIAAAGPTFTEHAGGEIEIGAGPGGFAYDNERPRHRELVAPFAIADQLVTCGEMLQMIDDGGYRRPELWLSDGWALMRERGWTAPRYWLERDGAWYRFGLHGLRPLDPAEPVSNLSYYEADAHARWAGMRLPTEVEWELDATAREIDYPEPGWWRPPQSLFGSLWQWTASPYVAYPGYRQPEGAFGEYNGKFMCNQMVLRGGSFTTADSHFRLTYRNFYKPEMRWQLAGLRLAREGGPDSSSGRRREGSTAE
jgi:ergothioneine biosynthesis protein EgtB